ncbi:DUF1127 domain-containing protein [Pseudomonas lalucatii]|uniref:DUF1127 domain-containing protein n=1 Tax=Pseudomonas lalucatii TaxID=1424203 RepID=A0ABS5Q7U0_9PSED|nr:DUF1127 domain-containing protein [Pseudomonas lalucatii]MBS7664432.1 DUF1127 domain-containing protein [Pseudomonas lalucatii]MBS7691049.1 DUF1127 domain-containing protein [Pseudomonas lalucatii]MBS7725618.1 DUF1127 domain-containing protein [Pseudomonas lalucatii]QVM88763.1 DUF1127 domain-containing protein [Pseudomonas lalucatii]
MERTLDTSTLPLQPSHTRPLGRLQATLALWLRNARTRRQLAALDARQLADSGIGPAERQRELQKPFWR